MYNAYVWAQWQCATCPKRLDEWNAGSGFTCGVYLQPSKMMFARRNVLCPFNGGLNLESEKSGHVRVGQQKSKKKSRR